MVEVEIDLRRPAGCNENPIVVLTKVMNGGAEEFIVVARKSDLPLWLAKAIASKRGYSVEPLEEGADEVKFKFKKTVRTS